MSYKEKNMESILSETSWWQVNKLFAQEYGLDAAVLVVDLDSKQNYFKNKNAYLKISVLYVKWNVFSNSTYLVLYF